MEFYDGQHTVVFLAVNERPKPWEMRTVGVQYLCVEWMDMVPFVLS